MIRYGTGLMQVHTREFDSSVYTCTRECIFAMLKHFVSIRELSFLSTHTHKWPVPLHSVNYLECVCTLYNKSNNTHLLGIATQMQRNAYTQHFDNSLANDSHVISDVE